jgi:hypothetical protein
MTMIAGKPGQENLHGRITMTVQTPALNGYCKNIIADAKP